MIGQILVYVDVADSCVVSVYLIFWGVDLFLRNECGISVSILELC